MKRKLLVVLALCACAPGDAQITQPIALPNANPIKYPVAMWDERVEGEAVILLHVDATGNVDSTSVDSSSGHAALDSAALEGSRKLRFTPGKRGDKYVPMWTRLPVRFSLDSTATLGIPVSPDSTS